MDLYDEISRCALCGGTSSRELYTVSDMLAAELLRKNLPPEDGVFLTRVINRIVRCDACRLVFLSPRLRSEALNRLYELWYRYGYGEIFSDDRLIEARRREFENYNYNRLRKYVPNRNCFWASVVAAACSCRSARIGDGTSTGLNPAERHLNMQPRSSVSMFGRETFSLFTATESMTPS